MQAIADHDVGPVAQPIERRRERLERERQIRIGEHDVPAARAGNSAPHGAALAQVLTVADEDRALRHVAWFQCLAGGASVVHHDQLRRLPEACAQEISRRRRRSRAPRPLVVGRDDQGEGEGRIRHGPARPGLSRRRPNPQRGPVSGEVSRTDGVPLGLRTRRVVR